MPLSRSVIEKRAVKAGVKASKKRHHLITENELLSLRVQTLPAILRIVLGLLGIALLSACWFAWPSDSNTVQGLEAFFGIFALLFGIFGIRRTLANVLDSFGSGDFVDAVLELIGEAVSSIDL
jgi:peptidoglycan/LPS O-acetylase OafA/YrhL